VVTTLGRVLGTQLGTVLDDFTEAQWSASVNAAKFDATKLYAVTGFSATNYLTTQPSGGERGSTAGFGVMMLVRPWKLPTTTQGIVTTFNPGATTGYLYRVDGGTRNNVWIANISSTNTSAPAGLAWMSSDIGRIHLLVGQVTGAEVRQHMNRMLRAGTAATGANYTPGTAAQVIGTWLGNPSLYQADAIDFLATASFVGTPSDADLLSLYDSVRTSGTFPATMVGATITHRVSVKDALASANAPVTNGQLAPDTLPDTVTNAPIDAMTRTGSPTVRVIDPATPRLWSYETTPIYQGGSGFSQTSYYTSSFDDDSSASGFWWALLLYMPVVTQSSHVIAGAAGTATGFDVRVNSNNAVMNWYLGDGTAFNVSGSFVIQTGKINLMVGVWDGPGLKQRTYGNRVEIGTGVTRTGYAPPAAGTKLGLGRTTRDPTSAGGTRTFLGYAQGLGVPSLAQVQALYDSVQATERMQAMPGLTASVLVDFTQQVTGGALPASLANQGATGGTFAATGAPTVTPVYARAYGW
jgi:hypothetical protein